MQPTSQAVHEMWLPPSTDPVAVQRFVDERYPRARRVDDAERRGWALSRWSTLSDPEEDPSGRVVWTVSTLRERDEPPAPGTTDADGLYRCFPEGLPVYEEKRVLAAMVGIARRLGGDLLLDVRPDGTGRVLRPDPLARLDLSIYSAVAVDPEMLTAVMAAVEPAAAPAMDATEWTGPPITPGDPYAEPQTQFLASISPDDRAQVHAFAEQFDAQVLARPDSLDAYAVEADLDWAGTIVVEAHAEEELPAPLRELGWRDPVAYDVRWLPVDPREAERDNPSGAHRHARTHAAVRLRAVAKAVAQATAGVIVDPDGFSVDAHQL